MKLSPYIILCLLLLNIQIEKKNVFFPIQKTSITGKSLFMQNIEQQNWRSLFDGKTLNGWRTYKNRAGSWKVKDGALCSERASDTASADLITNDEFKNFELSIDWKISPKGNSGIMYLVTEDHEQAYESGPEYQLIDDDGFPEHIEEWQKTGASYAIQPPSVKAANTPGEWNNTIIIVNNGHVEHWLNGKKIVEYELKSDKWNKEKAAGKWKDEADYGAAKMGHIALQAAHSNIADTYICFRNIKIKLL